MLAQSTCTQAAIGNWVGLEYPLWVGLQHEHYGGVLNDFNVDNDTQKLEPSYRPCASITQQGKQYVTPNNGTVNVQQSDLALSIDAEQGCDDPDRDSQDSRARCGEFACCRVVAGVWPGTELFPFWSPVDRSTCSAILRSRSNCCSTWCRQFLQSTVGLFEANGQSVPTTMGDHTIRGGSRSSPRCDTHRHRCRAERRGAPPVADLERRDPQVGRVLNSLRSGQPAHDPALKTAAQAVARTTMTQLSSWSGPPPPAQNRTSLKPAPSSHLLHSGGVGSRMKCLVCRVSPSR